MTPTAGRGLSSLQGPHAYDLPPAGLSGLYQERTPLLSPGELHPRSWQGVGGSSLKFSCRKQRDIGVLGLGPHSLGHEAPSELWPQSCSGGRERQLGPVSSGSSAPEDLLPRQTDSHNQIAAPLHAVQCFKARHSPVTSPTPVWGRQAPRHDPHMEGTLGKGPTTHQTLGSQLRQLMHHAVWVIQDGDAAGAREGRRPP